MGIYPVLETSVLAMLVKDYNKHSMQDAWDLMSEWQLITECQCTRLVVSKFHADFPFLTVAGLHDICAFTVVHI